MSPMNTQPDPPRMCDPDDKVLPPRQPHDQVPLHPRGGDTFTCSCCGTTAEYVELDDGKPGEWVQTSTD
ncbi:MAG: hypothetical protein ACRDTJ_32595 [Pseudonocardiaceae bacterium]